MQRFRLITAPQTGAAPGWKPPSHWLADEIVRENVNLGGSACIVVLRALERDHEAVGELRTAAAQGDVWTRDLVALGGPERGWGEAPVSRAPPVSETMEVLAIAVEVPSNGRSRSPRRDSRGWRRS